MYGKIDPGARQPYRTIRSKGIQPGCKYFNIAFITVIINVKRNVIFLYGTFVEM